MDKNAVKKFAVNARRKLIDSVSQKAYGLGISKDEIKEVEQIPNGSRIKINNDYVYLTDTETEHRERLIDQIEYKGYEQVMEEVAYTWFNRIIAIRFMEVNDYLPTRVRVLSSEDENKVEPDAVTQALELIEDLGLDREKIYNYQDNNDTEGLFKYVFIKQCNVLGKIMPVMFEKIQDYTELLLPDNLLVEGSVIRDLIIGIEEDDFKEQVEIIGWLYQYYISRKKSEVDVKVDAGIKVKKHDLPAKTQMFTTDWIVRYMIENSVARVWLEYNENKKLQDSFMYYLDGSDDNSKNKILIEVKKNINKNRKKITPEDITILDPCMGSGHMLVCAFDVLYKIYLEEGYSEKDIPRFIIEKNIYGLDIDDRAGQLAYFSIMMKARSYSKRFFRYIEKEPIHVNLCSIYESNGFSNKQINYFAKGDEELKNDIECLIDMFYDAKEYGSMLIVKKINFVNIENRMKEIEDDKVNLFDKNIILKIIEIITHLLNQYKIMIKKYDVVATNPPYLGRNNMNKKLTDYLNKHFEDSKGDLFAVFIEVGNKFLKENGFLSMITSESLMFISSYEKLRQKIINNNTIYSMLHLGANAFEELGVKSTAFILRNIYINNYKGKYLRLINLKNTYDKENVFFNCVREYDKENTYIVNQNYFNKIPGKPIAYWCSKKILEAFLEGKLVENIYNPKAGISTGNNDLFLKLWYEVNNCNIEYKVKSYKQYKESNFKWYLYNKGGGYRKWYGNTEYVINLQNNGEDIKAKISKKIYRLRDPKDYFKEKICWPQTGSDKFSTKYIPNEVLIDRGSCAIYFENKISKSLLALLNSRVIKEIANMLNPTNNFTINSISKIPILDIDENKLLKSKVDKNINISVKDWNSFETSWDFKKHPIIEFKSNNIENSFENWSDFTEKQFNQLKSNEEELNRIFIDIYGLQDELTPEVEDKDITIRKADRDREMKSFISYAVGCMMGRYSLDEEGLVFAGGEFDINRYKTFKADKDAIIPITDMEYFEDDIVSRFVEFVKVVFGEETLEENLNYIADTECFKRKANETSRDCLRRYFLKGFMEDHVKVYQKRPIYWMFDSGKQNGFKALIYMHRYDENMVSKVRADYLHVLQRKYESEINRLDNDINSEILSTKEKTAAKKRKEKIQKQLAECKQYDQVIAHVAHQRIAIDLDDGVKVNYQKFQSVEVPQGNAKKDLKQDLLFKVKM